MHFLVEKLGIKARLH